VEIVFFSYPDFTGQQSIRKFTHMLVDGMNNNGHSTQVWAPKARFFSIPSPYKFKKWLGYIDQYLVFPIEARLRITKCRKDTLFVFTDHSQGPWVGLIGDRPHVIHCHDFIAQRSAIGEVPENYTSVTGKIYQKYIRAGYSKGRNFISISNKTNEDLKRFLPIKPAVAEVVYNGFNRPVLAYDKIEARVKLGNITSANLLDGYFTHVGGNLFYKNRIGVIEIYNNWRATGRGNYPLILIGEKPSKEILDYLRGSPYESDVYFICDASDDIVQMAYSGALMLIFPSLMEGFGWPIAEAMASGCLVITTNEAPMTEVAGDAGFFIARKPSGSATLSSSWVNDVNALIDKLLSLDQAGRESAVEAGYVNAKRFDTKTIIKEIEKIYHNVLDQNYPDRST
jgi:glycosyltransferase involved in cell wall biosynthesis